MKFTPLCQITSSLIENFFHLKLLRHFKDIAVFVVGSFILPHPIHIVPAVITLYKTVPVEFITLDTGCDGKVSRTRPRSTEPAQTIGGSPVYSVAL